MLKRFIDILLSLVILFFTFPIFLWLMVLIKIDSQGSIIFKQKRIGKNGKEFTLYKLRTMDKNTPAYELKPRDDDPRITRVGKFLRETGLDELPQLFNVLEGQMSLVGPRPEIPFIVKNYTEEQRQRLKVKPGITGLWQISGKTKQPILENLQYDFDYINNQSMLLDFKILVKTFKFSLNNIYHLFR